MALILQLVEVAVSRIGIENVAKRLLTVSVYVGDDVEGLLLDAHIKKCVPHSLNSHFVLPSVRIGPIAFAQLIRYGNHCHVSIVILDLCRNCAYGN